MNIRRFLAKNAREALNLVKNELGDDASIISNRMVDGMAEVLAVRNEEMDELIHGDQTGLSPIPSSTLKSNEVKILDHASAKEAGKKLHPEKIKELAAIFATKPQARKSSGVSPSTPVNPSSQAQTASIKPAQNPEMKAVMSEIRQIRDLFSTQLTEISWGSTQQRNPVKKDLLRTIIAAGFSIGLAKRIVDKCPIDFSSAEALTWSKGLIARNIQAVENEADILDAGGIYALLGPTGVGKTTTLAKMAARFVIKHGSENLALITTDAYRIGGHEQLRTYGKILGVMVHAVKDESDLKLALKEFKNKHTILIDTVGLSQRDAMVNEQINMLYNADHKIKKLLCLNAGNTIETLNDVTRNYMRKGLDGCVITKIDEAVTYGGALNVAIQHQLKVHYVTNGQRVPEDIELMNKPFFVDQAFDASSRKMDISTLSDDDLPFLVADGVSKAQESYA